MSCRYIPIDISEGAIADLVKRIEAEMPEIEVGGLVCEYADGLNWLSSQGEHRSLLLFLGSNIGNFNKARARAFLRRQWTSLQNGDYALIGFDLKKDISVISSLNRHNGLCILIMHTFPYIWQCSIIKRYNNYINYLLEC